VRNDFPAMLLRALSARERAVAERARHGISNKRIALELGISEPTVSRQLRSAAHKLGLSSLLELAELGAGSREGALYGLRFGPDQLLVAGLPLRAIDALAELTTAEREVLADVLRGCSNGEIALLRRRAARTIVNQVAGVFAKLGVHSRRELVARLSLG